MNSLRQEHEKWSDYSNTLLLDLIGSQGILGILCQLVRKAVKISVFVLDIVQKWTGPPTLPYFGYP